MKGILVTFILLAPLMSSGQATLSVDRSEMVIGDQFTARISTNLSDGRELVNVAEIWPDTLESIEVVSGPEWDRSNPSAAIAIWKVSVFDTGWVRIPSLLVVIRSKDSLDSLYTNDIPLRVHPVQPDSTGLLGIKDIYEQPFNPGYYKKYIPHAIGVILLLSALWYWLRRRKSKQIEEVVQPPPPEPDVWAFEALRLLEQKKLWQHGEVKAHYSDLTGILREYLERRYGIHAMEQTSEEIIQQLQKQNLTHALLRDTEQLLSVADLIKFAKADPGKDIHADTIQRVHVFVEQTTPVQVDVDQELNQNDSDAAVE